MPTVNDNMESYQKLQLQQCEIHLNCLQCFFERFPWVTLSYSSDILFPLLSLWSLPGHVLWRSCEAIIHHQAPFCLHQPELMYLYLQQLYIMQHLYISQYFLYFSINDTLHCGAGLAAREDFPLYILLAPTATPF